MLSKSGLLFISILTVGNLVSAQDAPKPKEGKVERTFAFAFDGDGGYLGVQTAEVTKDNFSKFGLASVRGVAIEKVVENSPAAAAGLQNRDILIRIDGDEVSSSRKLTRLISEISSDHQVKITVLRNNSEQEVTATLTKRPMPRFDNSGFGVTNPGQFGRMELPNLPDIREFPRSGTPGATLPTVPDGNQVVWRSGEGRQIGVNVYAITKQLGEKFGVAHGVMVNTVRDGSPAAKAGLKAGDIITEADGKAMKNNLDLIKAVNIKKDGDLQLTVVRDRNSLTMNVTPEISRDGSFIFENVDGFDGLMTAPRPGSMTFARPAVPSSPSVPAATDPIPAKRVL